MSLTKYGTAKGSIPKDLVVVLRDTVPYETPVGTITACAAFVTDAASKTALDTAKDWADGYRGAGATKTPMIVTCPNAPIPHLRVVNLEERGEGGRAWKVLTPENWYVDFREDVFLDVLKAKCTMVTHPNGGLLIQGPFKWVKYGTQMRLALINSDLYREIEAYEAAIKSPKPKKIKNLIVGGIYTTDPRFKDTVYPVVFLGNVRYAGEKFLAFLAPGNTLLCWTQGLQEHFDALVTFSPQPQCFLQRNHSLVEQIGTVTLPASRKRWRYMDVFWNPLDSSQVEWL